MNKLKNKPVLTGIVFWEFKRKFANLGYPVLAEQAFGWIVKSGEGDVDDPTLEIWNLMVVANAKSGNLTNAFALYEAIQNRNLEVFPETIYTLTKLYEGPSLGFLLCLLGKCQVNYWLNAAFHIIEYCAERTIER